MAAKTIGILMLGQMSTQSSYWLLFAAQLLRAAGKSGWQSVRQNVVQLLIFLDFGL